MKLKGITDEDFVNYKKPSMFIAFPHCTFKCEKECGERCCQNSALAASETIEMPCREIVDRYLSNPITSAVVCGGLEPFDDFPDLYNLIWELRRRSNDDVVIYTGYRRDEITEKIQTLSGEKNIVVKFGRYIPGQEPHTDPILGVALASDNQYAERIS